jgi:hypothetical protein
MALRSSSRILALRYLGPVCQGVKIMHWFRRTDSWLMKRLQSCCMQSNLVLCSSQICYLGTAQGCRTSTKTLSSIARWHQLCSFLSFNTTLPAESRSKKLQSSWHQSASIYCCCLSLCRLATQLSSSGSTSAQSGHTLSSTSCRNSAIPGPSESLPPRFCAVEGSGLVALM